MSAPHGTGRCPHCHVDIRLTFRGRLRDHSRPNYGHCDGSGKTPVAGTIRTGAGQ